MDLKTIRKSKGLTQQELADAIGRDRSLIAKIENEAAMPSVDTAKRIGKVLNLRWENFFNYKGENKSRKVKSR